MEKTFLKGTLSLLYKSKAKTEEFLSCMAKEFRTLDLELYSCTCDSTIEQLDYNYTAENDSSDSDID